MGYFAGLDISMDETHVRVVDRGGVVIHQAKVASTPEHLKRSRDVGRYLGLVPRRYQSGEVDYTGSISKCGDRRVRTLLYEAANVMLTHCKRPLKLKEWAMEIAKRSMMRKARIALARRLAIIIHAMLRRGTKFKPA